MGFDVDMRNFRLNCVVRVLLIAGTITLLVLLWPERTWFTLALLAALIAAQILSLVRYVEYTNQSLILFLRSIEFRDFSSRVKSGPSGRTFGGLVDVFNEILVDFREMAASREESLRYLTAMIQHVGVGVLVYDQDGDVVMLNHAARRLLDVPQLTNVSELADASPDLLAALRDTGPGEPILSALSVGGELRQLSVHTSELRQRHQKLTLVSLQDIGPELNEKEMEAWRNLIRVLTHEIKNSLTPIASLAASVAQLAAERAQQRTDREPEEKIRAAMSVIQKRSHGLLQFVDSYRDLTHIPPPDVSVFPVADLFARIESLIAPQLAGSSESKGSSVRLEAHIDPPTMKLTGDVRLIEQVLINLVKNALEAIRGRSDGRVRLVARFDDRSRPIVAVIDNGPGILAEALEKVFIPFYSTKPEGTGIGLSWSRQILRLHRGDLTVVSQPGVETVFSLIF